MTVHRFIPAGAKHGDKTACGIPIVRIDEPLYHVAHTADGGMISVTSKGLTFDCKRCRRVLEIRHGDK